MPQSVKFSTLGCRTIAYELQSLFRLTLLFSALRRLVAVQWSSEGAPFETSKLIFVRDSAHRAHEDVHNSNSY